MNSKVYKWCAVPLCKNTSKRTANKVFVHVPNKKIIRDKWLKLARRNPSDVVSNSPLYFCEDHFDLPNDMANYMEYHVMGSVSQVRTKPGCMPHKFECQPDRKTQTPDTTEQPYIAKKRRIKEKCLVKEQSSSEEIASGSSVQQNVEEVPQLTPRVLDKSIQVHTRDPSRPNVNYLSKLVKKKVKSVQIESTSDCEMLDDDESGEHFNALECTLKKILKKPRSYIGIPLSCYYLVKLIEQQTNIPFNHVLLCLKKIRLNNSFCELADDFGIDRTYSSKIFFKNIPIIASVMHPFIVTLDKELIKKNLPVAFRHKYNTVTCIIQCLEIEIEKSSNVLNAALSWSDDKKANTIKHLISCTPNGFISYISNGYGGGITDTCIVETSDFSKCLQPNMWVMADRGFKHVEVYLEKMDVLLVRPPSVVSGGKLTEAETKEIASLRIHVEQVLSRLHEFNMLKPHACLNLSLVKVLDDVVTIACGLINIQDSLIK